MENLRQSQQKLLKGHLFAGYSITQPEAVIKYSIGRLAARCHELKQEGVPIQSRFIDYTRADGTVVKIKSYWIEKAA